MESSGIKTNTNQTKKIFFSWFSIEMLIWQYFYSLILSRWWMLWFKHSLNETKHTEKKCELKIFSTLLLTTLSHLKLIQFNGCKMICCCCCCTLSSLNFFQFANSCNQFSFVVFFTWIYFALNLLLRLCIKTSEIHTKLFELHVQINTRRWCFIDITLADQQKIDTQLDWFSLSHNIFDSRSVWYMCVHKLIEWTINTSNFSHHSHFSSLSLFSKCSQINVRIHLIPIKLLRIYLLSFILPICYSNRISVFIAFLLFFAFCLVSVFSPLFFIVVWFTKLI